MTHWLTLILLITTSLAPTVAADTVPVPTGPQGQRATTVPQVPEGIVLVAGNSIDLTWQPEDYPAGTFLRVEVYRGLSSDALGATPVAVLTDPTAWFYRDTALAWDTTYYYRTILYYHPASDPDHEAHTTLFSDDATTGDLHGRVYQDLGLPAGTYRLGQVTVYDGARLSIPNGTIMKQRTGSSELTARDGYLTVDGVRFQNWTNITFGDDSPAAWGEGWVRDAHFDQTSRITVYGDHLVQLTHNTGADIDVRDAGLVVVTDNTGTGLNIGGTNTASDNTFENVNAYDSATLEHNDLGEIRLYDDAMARLNTVHIDARARGTSTLEHNRLPNLDLAENALARFNEITGLVELDGHARLEENYVTGEIKVDRDAPQALILDNTIVGGKISVVNDFSCDALPATAHIQGNTISSRYDTVAVSVEGGAVVTLLENEIDGSVFVTQECTRLTAQYNHIDGSLSTCWTPVLTVTDNVIDGSVSVGGPFVLTCSGDASGTIARNTLQHNRCTYDIAMYISKRTYTESHDPLSIRHNCFRDNTIAVDLFTAHAHGPVDLRYNWWGDASGPQHPSNPGGAGGRIQNEAGEPVVFDPWDTAPTYCRDASPMPLRTGQLILEAPDSVMPDGIDQVPLSIRVYDQYGTPYPNAPVNLVLNPALGQLSHEATTTDANGVATVWYTAPTLGTLGFYDAVEIKVWSGAIQEVTTLPFEAPQALQTAEPRFHAPGWEEWHALLPPDAGGEATLSAQLTLDGAPVRQYTVTLALESLDGVYDGAFTEGSQVVGSLEAHRATLLTDDQGHLWVKYRPQVQASRPTTVRDGVALRSDAFGHLASWEVETGMDLALLEARRPGERAADYVVMGQAEPLLLMVHDRLHPGFPLSAYNDRPGPIVDPEIDAFIGAQVDISHPARDVEFLDLLYMPHLQIPRHQRVPAYFYQADTGDVYLRTPTTDSNLPEILPWMEGYNIYWAGVRLRRTSDGQLVNDTYAVRQGDNHFQIDNNYRLLGVVANENLSTLETFFKDNPCNTDTAWGRDVKCALGILTWFPGLQTPIGLSSTLLNICETLFNYANGQYFNAAVGSGNFLVGEFSNYLQDHPELIQGRALSQALFERLKLLGTLSQAVDCFWAVYKGGETANARACRVPAGATDAQRDQVTQEMEIWVQGLLQAVSEDEDLDALVVLGSQDTALVANGSTTVLTATGALTVTDETYYSLVNDLGSMYLLPPGDYALALDTVTDTHVILFRSGPTITASHALHWDDPGTTPRQATLNFDAETASEMQVDTGNDGTPDYTVALTSTAYLAAPQDVQILGTDGETAYLSWMPVVSATHYHVYHGTESRWAPSFEGYAYSVDAGQATTLAVDSLVQAGNLHYFSVTALDEQGDQSLYSAEATLGEAGRMAPLYLPLVLQGE